MKAWTEDQYKAATRQQLERHLKTIRNKRDAQEELFSHQNEAYAGWRAFQEMVDSGKIMTRWFMGRSLQASSLMGITDPHWSSQDAKDFRYNSLPLFQGYATYVHHLMEGFLKPSSALHPMESAVEATRHAFEMTAKEHSQGFPWAHANMDKVEEYSTTTMDPYIFAGWITDGIKAAGASAEVARLVPHAAEVMKAMSENRSVVLATKALWGADSGSPSFMMAMRDMIKSGGAAEQIAAWMHTVGFRTPEWAAVNPLPGSGWFKRGWNLYSPRLKDIAQDLLWMKDAVREERARALANVPDITQKELPIIQEILSKVPRDPFKPVESFVANYLKASMEGRLPDGTPLHVPFVEPETFEKLKLLVHDLSAGWRGDSKWLPAYSPSKTDNEFAEALSGKASRVWQMKRANYTPFDNVDEFRKAVSIVKTRVFKAAKVDELEAMTKMRVANINKALQEFGGGIDHGYIDDLRTMAADLKKAISNAPKKAAETADAVFAEARGHIEGRIQALETELDGWKTRLFHTEQHASSDFASKGIRAEIDRIEKALLFEREKLANLPAPRAVHLTTTAQLEGQLSAVEQSISAFEKEALSAPGLEARYRTLPPDVRRLIGERQVLINMSKDLKEMADSPDLLRIVADKDPSGIARHILDRYDGVLRTFKMLAVRPNPFVWWHQITDIGMLRPFMETGENPVPAVLKALKDGKVAPGTDLMGRTLDFSHSPVELLYGKERRSATVLQRAGNFLDSRFSALHSAAYNMVGRFHYEKNLGEQLKFGLGNEAAHNYAHRAARAALDVMHGTYDNVTAAQRVMNRFFPFVGHYVQRASYWGTKAVEHPSAAYAFVKAREWQMDHSVDRKGAMPIPYTNWAWDPGRRLTPFQVAGSVLEADNLLNAQEPGRFKMYRGLQAITGEPFPWVDLAAQAVGAAPQKELRPLNDGETALAYMSNAMGKGEVMPSDPLYSYFGKNPDEDRIERTERFAAMQMVAAQKRGEPISRDEAWDRARQYQSANKLGSYFGLVYDTNPEMRQVREAAADYRDTLLKTPPELRGMMRFVVAQEYEDKYPGISRTFVLDPVTRQGAMQKQFDIEDARTKSELEQRKTEAADAVKSSWMGQIFEKAFNLTASPAGASEFEDRLAKARELAKANPVVTPQLDKPAMEYKVGAYGAPVATGGDSSYASRLEKAKATAEMNTHLQALRQLNPTGQHEYIAQKLPTNPTLLNSLRLLAPTDSTARSSVAGFDYVQSGGEGQLRGELTPAARERAQAFSRIFSNFVVHSGNAAEYWLTAPPDKVRQLVKDGKLELPVGMDHNRIDKDLGDYEVTNAQQMALPMAGIARRNYEQKLQQQYPLLGKYVGDLQDAVRHPSQMGGVIDSVNQAVAHGDLPDGTKGTPHMWELLASDPRYRNLYQNVGIASSFGEAKPILDRMFITNYKTGRIVDVNEAALFQIALSPNHPALPVIQAARQGDFGNEYANALNQKIPTLPGEYPAKIDKATSATTQQIQDYWLARADLHVQNPAAPIFQIAKHLDGPALLTDTQESTPPRFKLEPRASDYVRMAPVEPLAKRQDIPQYQEIAKSLPAATPGFAINNQGFIPFRNSSELLVRSIGDWERDNKIAASSPSYVPGTFSEHLMKNAKDQWANGSTASQVAIGTSAVSTALQLGQTFDLFPTDGPGAGAVVGLSVGIQTMMMLGGPANPVADVVGVAAGVFAGLKSSKRRAQSNAQAQSLEIQRQRLELDRQRFAEQQRQQSVTDYRRNEQDIARSLSSGTPVNRANVMPQLEAFRRRPTFSSKIGLVDALTREMAGALKPRY